MSACSNPITLLCGEVCCSPYRNKEQTDTRTTVCQMGYPYNFEPLNFVRAAMSLICSSFAAFQILSYRKTFQVSEALVSIPASATDSGETDSGETDSGEQAEEEDEETGPAMMYWIYSCFGIVVIYTSMMVVRWYVLPCLPLRAWLRFHLKRTRSRRLAGVQVRVHQPLNKVQEESEGGEQAEAADNCSGWPRHCTPLGA